MASKKISYSSQEDFKPQTFKVINHNIYEKKHLERSDDNNIIVVSDGFFDIQEEINSERKNAGLQNILAMQEMRYGTVDNAIARAADRGVYADVSKIPTDVAGQAAFIAKAQSDIAKLKSELGLTDDDLKSITAEKLAAAYQAKAAAAAGSNQEGGNE